MSWKFATSMADLTKPSSWSDVTFIVEGRCLYFRRAILSGHSPVFETMFNSNNFLERGMTEIKLPETTFDDLHAFLRLLARSPTCRNPITEQNLESLLAMADKFETYPVAGMCGDFMLSNWMTKLDKALKAVELAVKYRLEKRVLETFISIAVCRPLAEIDAAKPLLPANVYVALLRAKVKNLVKCGPHYILEKGKHKYCHPDSDDLEPPVNDPLVQEVVNEAIGCEMVEGYL